MDYIGEHLLPGRLGHFFILLSIVASLLATFSYFLAVKSKAPEDVAAWKKLARLAFFIEVLAVVAIFCTLFYVIHNHLFEYHYAWKHSSLSLEFKYMLASFWEGMEGSFLLWSFWHCVLGLLIIKTGKTWEAPVMGIINLVQFFITTMIAGLYFFGEKIGSNPFILLRDSGVLDNAPALHLNFDINQPLRPDYLFGVKDGNDLNILLQNYWMVIHPPVLFLGFASTVVPFAFAIAGLWKKNFSDWIKPALPWALFSCAVLGVGIMMGARWAYESLNFGGYWAWDPVENASLVPWLVLVAGIHTLLIYKHSGHSLRSTHLFFILSFVLVLYSSFLTKSGLLGETSVHAFTDMGLNKQMFLILYAFIWLGAILGAKNKSGQIQNLLLATALLIVAYFVPLAWPGALILFVGIGFTVYQIQSQVPTIRKEEETSSREFWMFIGSLLFFLAAIVIIIQTSLPILNKLVNLKRAPSEDPEYAYNGIQIYVAIVVAILTAVTQYLKYKSTSFAFFRKKIIIPTILSIIIAALLIAFGSINYSKQGPMFKGALWLALICAIYSFIANASYIWIALKGNLRTAGGSVSHVGFAMVLTGILLSSSNKELLSINRSGIMVPFGEDNKEKSGENLTLVHGAKTDMGSYWATYISDSVHPKKPKWFYEILFESKDSTEKFTLWPNAFVNYKMEGMSANPAARHFWDHDILTHVTSIYPDPDKANKDTSSFNNRVLKPGDTAFYSKGIILLDTVRSKSNLPEDIFGKNGRLYEAALKVQPLSGNSYSISPKLAFVKNEYLPVPDTLTAQSLILQLQKVNADNSIELGIKESDALLKYITLKAYKFPFINLLWLGIIVTAIGILMSMFRRIGLNRKMDSRETSA